MKGVAGRRQVFRLLALAACLSLVVQLFVPVGFGSALASSVVSVVLSGGYGGPSNVGQVYARNGNFMTLSVTASADTMCLRITIGIAAPSGVSSGIPHASWTPSFQVSSAMTPGGADGPVPITVQAYPAPDCTGTSSNPGGVMFILDNTPPATQFQIAPAPNGAGWNNTSVTLSCSATDNGSGMANAPLVSISDPVNGVGTAPLPNSMTWSNNTATATAACTATDHVGNTVLPTLPLRIDKIAPQITAARSPAPNAAGWNNTDVVVTYSCVDAPLANNGQPTLSGIKSCTLPVTVSTSAANQSATGTAVDNADNSTTSTLGGINIDKIPPTLTGTPATPPNAAGWYNTVVAIHWTASDSLSGLASPAPANSFISSEGTGQTATASISDLAGNTTTAASSPAVNIDLTPPNTTATAPTSWNNTDVTVSLNASDNLSGVAATYYTLDGGPQQSGTSVSINTEGVHALQFWSVDNAGNTEAAKAVQVKIDKTPPTINHTLAPAPNGSGWNNTPVTVHFICADSGGSGLASCTGWNGASDDGIGIATEGQNQVVVGTASDNAGNTAADPASVSIDETAPSIQAAADRAANANHWYNADVSVAFTCSDSLSGIAACAAPIALTEGANQTATGSAMDAAGNTASTTLNGINVDKTPPVLTWAAAMPPNANGWYNADVAVHWIASDALSGLDGSGPADSAVTGEGTGLVAAASVSDLAGNSTSATAGPFAIDRTPPITVGSTASVSGGVQVTLTPGPDLSGIDKTYYTVDGGAAQVYTGAFVVASGASHTVVFWSVDKAGNVEDNTGQNNRITIVTDGTPPSISGAASPAPNGYGWNNTPVMVTFTCSDAESGIATCTSPVTLSGEGAGQSVTGYASDNAGNTNSATVGNINIDLTAPTIALAGVADFYYGFAPAAPTCTTSDALSGPLNPDDCTVSGWSPSAPAGSYTVTGTGHDRAGNQGAASGQYTVKRYEMTGFFQPVDMTTTSTIVWNTVKGGSTVPLKFQGFAGAVALTDTAYIVQPLAATKVSCSTTVDAPIEELAATSGTDLHYDATAGQFIYNWQTPKTAGTCYKVTVSTTSGSSLSAYFKLK